MNTIKWWTTSANDSVCQTTQRMKFSVRYLILLIYNCFEQTLLFHWSTSTSIQFNFLFSSNRRRVHYLLVRERLVHQRKVSLVRPVYKRGYRMVSVQGWYVFLLSLRLWPANEERCWMSTVEGSVQSFFVSVHTSHNRILGKKEKKKKKSTNLLFAQQDLYNYSKLKID